jgi:ABC-type multidrug transport system ATPase subunit
LTSSTPDALWSAPSLRLLRPAAVVCTDLRRGRDLDRCSLSVPAGGRLLLVSDPDSTASTLLRVLAGLSRAERGRIRIAGSTDAGSRGWGRRVTYLGPHPGLHTWMTPLEALQLASELIDLAPADRARRIERAAAWARIPPGAMAQPMSRGGTAIQQRTGLAAALIGDPEVVLLDEPLRALESEERRRLLCLPGRRRTVLLASRYPASEVGLAAHVVYLSAGRVELIAPVAELEAAGLSLSHRGIEALAAMRAAGAGSQQRAPRTA